MQHADFDSPLQSDFNCEPKVWDENTICHLAHITYYQPN